MNEYEKHCAMIAFDLALTRAPSEMPTTMWKYIKKIFIKLDEKSLINYLSNQYPSKGIQFQLLDGVIALHTEKALNYIKEHFNLYENELMYDENFHQFVKYMKKWEATPKYIIGKEETTKINNNLYKCYRIIANKDIPTYANSNNGYQLIKKGTPGGCIKSEENLSQKGFCWLNNESYILGKAKLEGNSYLHQSYLYGHAKVEGNSKITFSIVCQNATVKGHNDVHMSRITGNVIIQDDVYVHSSNINDNVEIFGSSYIYFSNLSEDIWVEDSLLEHINKNGNQKIKGENLCKNTN